MDLLAVAWRFTQELSFLAGEARCQDMCAVYVALQKWSMAER